MSTREDNIVTNYNFRNLASFRFTSWVTHKKGNNFKFPFEFLDVKL